MTVSLSVKPLYVRIGSRSIPEDVRKAHMAALDLWWHHRQPFPYPNGWFVYGKYAINRDDQWYEAK